jgi:hypothetical protein
VVVLTQYDKLVRTKKKGLKKENRSLGDDELNRRSEEEARTILKDCATAVESAFDPNRDKSQTLPPHIEVSSMCLFTCVAGVDRLLANEKYERSHEQISRLVELTRDLVGDAWLVWATAQRASLPLKIEACIE